MKNKIWLKNYPKGVPENVNSNQYETFNNLFEDVFQKFSELYAFENMGKKITYSEFDILTRNFASFLINDLGMKKGERLVIQTPNLLQYPIALFAALRSGIIVVNTNPLYTPTEMEHQFKDSGAKAILILSNFAYNLEKIIENTDIRHVIITDMGDMIGGIKGKIINFVVKYVKKLVPKYNIKNLIKFNEALNSGKKHQFQSPELSSNDIAFLQYTGGTTGVSKGAMLTHYNVLSNLEQMTSGMNILLEEKNEICITALPLYHIFALVCNALAMFKFGAKNVLITNPRDMKGFIKELSKHKFSVITGVNTLFNGLLNADGFKDLDFSKLKASLGGGMAVQEVVALKWKEITGCPLVEGYGLTETSPVVTMNPLDGTERIGTIGLPLPSTDVKFIDDDNNEVDIGERGEICVKGPQVMKGYWQRPNATKEVMENNWLKTGDIAVIDNDGFVQIVDRKKEMVLVSGFNVYPNEVENVIASHPKVLEVGVIGVPDSKTNEAVKAYVVKKDQSLIESEINDHCREHLTNYKRPKHIAFTDELPKSNVGKILRRIIKENDLKTNTY